MTRRPLLAMALAALAGMAALLIAALLRELGIESRLVFLYASKPG